MLWQTVRILVPIPGRINLPGRLALGRNDSVLEGCCSNGALNSTIYSEFAE